MVQGATVILLRHTAMVVCAWIRLPDAVLCDILARLSPADKCKVCYEGHPQGKKAPCDLNTVGFLPERDKSFIMSIYVGRGPKLWALSQIVPIPLSPKPHAPSQML